jgi:hypothetical protein
MTKSVSDLKAQIIDIGMATTDNVRGCTDEQISKLAAKFKVTLPESYKEFLKAMGVSAGDFLVGSDLYYADLPNFRRSAQRLLRRRGWPFHLRPKDFIFLNHQDYQFLFFDTTAGDDPPVLRYIEGQVGPEEVDKHFSNWLVRCVQEECQLFDLTRD